MGLAGSRRGPAIAWGSGLARARGGPGNGRKHKGWKQKGWGLERESLRRRGSRLASARGRASSRGAWCGTKSLEALVQAYSRASSFESSRNCWQKAPPLAAARQMPWHLPLSLALDLKCTEVCVRNMQVRSTRRDCKGQASAPSNFQIPATCFSTKLASF